MLASIIFCFLIAASASASALNCEKFCLDVYWTQWFDRDNPSGTGDWETLSDLRSQYPNAICDYPSAVEAQTTSGQPAELTGESFSFYDVVTGFVCRNVDQRDNACNDYRVRFFCPPAYWTQWFDRDNPSGTGDWETLSDLRSENPNVICNNPTAIEAQTTSGQAAEATGEIFDVNDVVFGFACKKEDQPDNTCLDYRVRFYCPLAYWTQWFDRDDPSGTGDWETLIDLRREHPNVICDNPNEVEAQTTSGQAAEATGEIFDFYDVVDGFVCKKEDQPDNACLDYRVRFCCL